MLVTALFPNHDVAGIVRRRKLTDPSNIQFPRDHINLRAPTTRSGVDILSPIWLRIHAQKATIATDNPLSYPVLNSNLWPNQEYP